jgi:putative permease
VRTTGEALLRHFLTGMSGATTLAFSLFLIPLLVLFFLSDREEIQASISRLIPRDREFVDRIWKEMAFRMANYIRGKVWEILIVGLVSWVVFFALGFQYAAVMAIVGGISVIVPYVGAIGVAVPMFLLGLVQWGISSQLAWLMVAYVVIQALDGYVLVPMIFSEAVKLNPTVILLATLIFGAIWGFWGVFFAIPLATLTKAVASTWIEYHQDTA